MTREIFALIMFLFILGLLRISFRKKKKKRRGPGIPFPENEFGLDDGSSDGGGAGGGAVIIASAGEIVLDGSISANGGRPGASSSSSRFGGGGGSGGAIRLVAPTISGGDGSRGRIRVEAFFREYAGTANPTAYVSTPGLISLPAATAAATIPHGFSRILVEADWTP